MTNISRDAQEKIGAAVKVHLLPSLTVILTKFSDQTMQYSGTGLLLGYEENNLYCLTADHVVTPKMRTSPPRLAEDRHYHAEKLVFDGRSSTKVFRQKYYRNENLDLALLESSLSGSSLILSSMSRICDYSQIKRGGATVIEPADVLIICGMPNAKLTRIPITREFKYGAILHFVSGAQIFSVVRNEYRYSVPYSGSIPPDGLSGSPVWLVRDLDRNGEPIDIKRIERADPSDIKLQAIFAGVVVEYLEHDQHLSIVKPGACAIFAEKGEREMPRLRSAEEDVWIKAQLLELEGGG